MLERTKKEIDKELESGQNTAFGTDLEEIEKTLKDVAWDLEGVVNPTFSDSDDDTTIVREDYFD